MFNDIPIVLFVYKRLDHLKKCIESLKECNNYDQFPLLIFCDGAKFGEEEQIEEVRRFVKLIDGFKSLTIIERNSNFGLSNSILHGLDEVFEKYEKAIVIEDDLILHKQFLNFMKNSLNEYENSVEVCSISGYGLEKISSMPYFIRGADCWGWATWKSRWLDFERSAESLLCFVNENKDIKADFIDRSCGLFYGMLLDQVEGRIDSWAIRWLTSNYLKGKFTLFPEKSLVRNIGCDGSGTHRQIDSYEINYSNFVEMQLLLPNIIIENSEAVKKIRKHFRKLVWRHNVYAYTRLETWKNFINKITL